MNSHSEIKVLNILVMYHCIYVYLYRHQVASDIEKFHKEIATLSKYMYIVQGFLYEHASFLYNDAKILHWKVFKIFAEKLMQC